MKKALVAVAGLALVGTAAALASTFVAAPPVRVPDQPLAGGSPACTQTIAAAQAAGSVLYPDAEVEPHVAANPANPQHLVAAFQQDRWNDGGSNGLVAVVSRDGGASWTLSASQPRFAVCQGGTFDRTTDPWIAFSSDGRIVYAIGDSFDANGPAFGGASAILVSRSTDGGTTWQAPVTARYDASTTVLNDKEMVAADLTAPRTAYAIWDQLVSPSSHANPTAFNHEPAYRGPTLFSKTTDGGLTWSTGRVVYDPGENNQTIGNQIVQPSPGVLVDGFSLIRNKGGLGNNRSTSYQVAVIRSTDGGATWSGPTIVADQQVGSVDIAGYPVRSSDELPEFAAAPDGTLYAVWQDSRFTGTSKLALSQSRDGGLSWSAPVRADQAPGNAPAFVPQIHVAANGVVGLSYYSLERATAAKPGLTDAEIVHCHAACSTAAAWAAGGETRLTPTPFDYTTAPDAGGYFLGDYSGLTSSGSVFKAFYAMAQPVASGGRSDPFASSVG